MTTIVGPDLRRAVECEAILRTLPSWFGIEHALQMYVEDTTRLPTFALENEGRVIAFLSLREHFPKSWEIHCMAVEAEARGRGLGSMLLTHSEAWLVKRGATYLQVKTVAATSKSVEYAETREFYLAKGFAPLEIFPDLWDPWNPALQLIKCLGTV